MPPAERAGAYALYLGTREITRNECSPRFAVLGGRMAFKIVKPRHMDVLVSRRRPDCGAGSQPLNSSEFHTYKGPCPLPNLPGRILWSRLSRRRLLRRLPVLRTVAVM